MEMASGTPSRLAWLMKSLDEVAKIHPVVTGSAHALLMYNEANGAGVSGDSGIQGCIHNGDDPTE